MKRRHYLSGIAKYLFFSGMALHIAARYALRPRLFHYSLPAYLRFLRRALRLLLLFSHNKVVCVPHGYKFQLYLPAYPSPAFFSALENKLLRTPPAPITVVFSMTKACRYRCSHCYQHLDAGADLDEETLLNTARQIQELGVALFDIEGGEPLLRFPRLLRVLQVLDERSELWVNSSGSDLTPELLVQMKAAGLAGLMISLHSPDDARHDAFTGVPGSFTAACQALRLCRAHGVMAVMNSVLSEEEVRGDGIERLMSLARELECDFVQLIHPKRAGSWLGQTDGMMQGDEVLARIDAAHRRYNSRAWHNYPALAAQVHEERADMAGCTAGGIDRFYLNANGEVQPCEFLNLTFGNVQQEELAVIFARMRAAFPTPCRDWLCCTQADALQTAMQALHHPSTPLPRAATAQLVEQWERGEATQLYKELGIYR